MRFTWGVIVGLAIQGGLSQTSVPSEGELTLRQDTGVPDTEVPPTDVVEPPVVSDTPPVETGPADSPAADPTPTDVAPPQVTESEAPGSNTEPVGDASSVVGTGTQAPPPPQPTPSDGPVTASAQGGEETTEAATGAADNTEAADNTAVASETQAAGQTATRASDGSSGTTLTTRPAATSTVSVPVSLQSASVGDNAVVKQVDGKPAVVLSPPAGGQASFEVTAAKPQAVKEKDLVRVKANVTLTESTGGTGQAKDDPCNVKMDVNGKSVYNKDLQATTEGPFEITSDFFEAASGDQDIKFTQKCGQNPQQMTVNGMSLQGQVRAESGSGNGGSGGSGGSETSSADGSQSTGKDNASSTHKPAMFALGLVAALAVLVM